MVGRIRAGFGFVNKVKRGTHRTIYCASLLLEIETMKRVMVRYKVKPEHAVDNERYIERVFEQLNRESPKDLRYASFKMSDGLTFVHLASLEGDDNRLRALSAFTQFKAGLQDRCEEQPVAVELDTIGSFRFLG